MVKFTNKHDTNNAVITDKNGAVKILKPGESAELYDKVAAAKEKTAAKEKEKASKDAKEEK